MAEYPFDLHIHSCLSPCAENSSTPDVMAGLFALSGYKIAALTDHNSCGNCAAFLKACRHYGILGIPGMELNTAEEVHVICLFETLEGAMDFSSMVQSCLPDIKNRPDLFGDQLYSDEFGKAVKQEEKLLISATSIGIYSIADLVRSYGGVAYPAHIDRQSNSLLYNLGLWDPAMNFPLAELSLACPDNFAENRKDLKDIRTIRCSDAHRMEQIPLQAHQSMDIPSLDPACVINWIKGIK